MPLGKDHLLEGEYIMKAPEPPGVQDPEVQLADAEKLVMSTPDQQRREILVVEDNTDLRRFISDNLESEYIVVEAVDGEEGLHKAISHVPALVVTDIMMPGMNGMELCKRLKEDERTSHIPVIMLTAKATKEDRKEGLGLGADDYIIKPFEMEELVIRIRNLLEQRKKLREKYASMIGLDWESMSVTTLDEQFLKKITAYITSHIDDFDLNVNKVTGEMAMSREHLFRKLKALTGETPIGLIRTIRMKAAASLLEKTKDSITTISLNTGFSNPSHFARTFRKHFGKSPQEYRKEFTQSS
jgi:YesN/AraC family two-component response regulator